MEVIVGTLVIVFLVVFVVGFPIIYLGLYVRDRISYQLASRRWKDYTDPERGRVTWANTAAVEAEYRESQRQRELERRIADAPRFFTEGTAEAERQHNEVVRKAQEQAKADFDRIKRDL